MNDVVIVDYSVVISRLHVELAGTHTCVVVRPYTGTWFTAMHPEQRLNVVAKVREKK